MAQAMENEEAALSRNGESAAAKLKRRDQRKRKWREKKKVMQPETQKRKPMAARQRMKSREVWRKIAAARSGGEIVMKSERK